MATEGSVWRRTPMASVDSPSPAAIVAPVPAAAPPRPLSLQVDSPPSASPFPSPSSSFLPPPMPGAHEFAVRPPPRRRSAVSAALSGDDSTLSEPATLPTQYRLSRIATSTPEEPSRPALDTPPEPASASRRQSNSIASPTILNSPSLASSRPAPLSPAPSRRVSTISTRSSKSGTISRSNSKRESAGFPKRLSALSMTGIMTRKEDHPDAVFDDEPLITPTVSASSMNSRSTLVTSSFSSASPSTTTTAAATAITVPASLQPSSSTPTTTPQNSSVPSSSSTMPPPHPHPPTSHRRPTSTKIKIRDFAYTSTDNRYRGMGSDVPKPNQFSRLNKKLGGPKKARPTSERWSLCGSSKSPSSSEGDHDEAKKKNKSKNKKSGRGRATKRSSNGWDHSDDDDDDDDSSDEEEEEDYEEDGWFKRGLDRFSLSLGLHGFKKHMPDPNTPTVSHNTSYPSRGEMDQNFGTTIEDEIPSSESSEYYDAYEDETSNKGEVEEQPGEPPEEGMIDEEEPLYPGLYRALYPFEPEGTAEMRLVEDQIVRVVGRGGGVGWAVVIVPDGVDGGVVVVTPVDDNVDGEGKTLEEKMMIRHALVPESYLELVQLD